MEEERRAVEIDSKTKDLIQSWHQQAKLLKKKHPKWNAAKIQKEMKNRIIKQAESAIPTKSAKEYIERVNAQLKEVEDLRRNAINSIMNYMGRTHPESVAIVLHELDCGCIRACAVSKEGAPMGEMIMVSGKQVTAEYDCIICQKDGGANAERCIDKSIIWPGDESELPSDEFRLSIGKKVFGGDYSMEDI